jgi:hypothetical protein
VLSALVFASGCGGSSEPEPLKPMEPEVPADLCATVPASARVGLVSNSTTVTTGNPTAACSLRSPANSKRQARAVVTWVQLNDEVSAGEVFDSQCRSIDRTEFKEQAGFEAEGADRACAARGTLEGADSATMAAVSDREVVTVRLSEPSPATATAFARAQRMLEGVLASMAG